MTATFLVELEVDSTDPAALLTYTGILQETIEEGGLPLVSVKPWHRDSLAPAAPTLQDVAAALPQTLSPQG